MFFITYAFKGQVHVFAGRVKIVSHSSCRTSTILKYFCPLDSFKFLDKVDRATYICGGVWEDGRIPTGADPGFLDGGFIFTKGRGFDLLILPDFLLIFPDFLKILNEMK